MDNKKKALKLYKQLLSRAIEYDDQANIKKFQYYIDHSKDKDDQDDIDDEKDE